MREFPRRYGLNLVVFAASVVLFPACSSDGHLNLPGGYTSAPNYNCEIRTVYVPICQNKSTVKDLEKLVTRAIIREIKTKTPYLVVDSPRGADSELLCTIVNPTKGINNQNQLGEARDVQMAFSVEVFWKDRRRGHEGELLSGPESPLAKQRKRDPNGPIQGTDDKDKAKPVIVTPTTNYIPELGQSTASAQQDLANKAAVQIVSMMEVWP